MSAGPSNIERRPRRRIQFIRSNTFLWAFAVAAAFALFVVALFVFVYWKLDQYVIARSDHTIAHEITIVVGQALALGLLPAFCLCVLAGAWLSVRAQMRVEEVNQRIQRIVAGELRERLPEDSADDPFARLASMVNAMLDEMETMISALAGVGNDIAHDLRTPLTRARLTLERGRTHAATLEQLQDVADKAIAGIDQSLTIITALLRLTEIENNRRTAGFNVVALDEILREVCDVYEPIAEDKGVGLGVVIEHNVRVWGDRDLLFEAVTNLVDNAVKFTPPGGEVRLELESGEATSLVRVRDTGPGISEHDREMVLRRFYRSDKMRNTPGVGLGLSLVAAIVKLHGFRLIIGSAPGGRIEIVAGTGRQGCRMPVRDVASRTRQRDVMAQAMCEACDVRISRHV